MNYLNAEGLSILINNSNDRNYLINSNFKINQRNGYITKLNCTLYTDSALTNIVSNSNLSTKVRSINFVNDIDGYAEFIFDGIKYYVSINDIECGYTGASIYTLDRWHTGGYDTNIVKYSSNYITIGSNNLSEWEDIFQEIYNYESLKGKQVTFSVKLRTHTQSGALIRFCDSQTEVYESARYTGDWEIVSITRIIPENTEFIKVGIGLFQCTSGTLDIAWAKLEEGDMNTPYIDPEPILELLKCKYFYQEITMNKSYDAFFDNSISYITKYQTMRATPKISFKNNNFNMYFGAYISCGLIATDFNFRLDLDPNTNTFYIFADKESHNIPINNAILVIQKYNPICLDAEIIY